MVHSINNRPYDMNVKEKFLEPYKDCRNLVSLFLNENDIERVHRNAFKGLVKLKTLVLTRNSLSELSQVFKFNFAL